MPERRQNRKRPLTDPQAKSARPDEPAFTAPPANAPAYRGFPLIEETRTDGWCFGAISGYEDPDGCDCGDGFVVAPDGSQAGIIWQVGECDVEEVEETCPPDKNRWGVYGVWFPKPVRTTQDLVECFRAVLPSLRKIHAGITGRSSTQT
jgi:hypothetical protein